MAGRVVAGVHFDIVHIRTSHLRRAFDVTTKRHYTRTVKRSLFLQNIKGINAANVLPQEPPPPCNRLDNIRGIIEPLNDDSQFEYDDLSYMECSFCLFVCLSVLGLPNFQSRYTGDFFHYSRHARKFAICHCRPVQAVAAPGS